MSFVDILRPLQNKTAFYGGELLDKTGSQLTAAQIETMTLTLYDVATNTVINSRDGSTDLTATTAWGNSVVVSTADSVYNLEIVLTTADNAIVASSPPSSGEEKHRMIIEGTLATSGYSFGHEVDIFVKVVNRPSTA